MENTGFIISILIGLGYCYLTIVNSRNQKDKYYYKLLDTRTFMIHLMGTILLGLLGAWRVTKYDGREFMYFGPLVYLLCLRSFNHLTVLIYKRPLILATRWDSPPKGKNGIKLYDRIVSLILLFAPMVGGATISKLLQRWWS